MATNFITGTEQDDFIEGSPQTDYLLGLEGNDLEIGIEADDRINGNQNTDDVNGNRGDDTVRGGRDDDFVRGGQDQDFLFGDKGNDILWGDKGHDTVLGGLGSPVPIGPTGERDLVFGNTGNDHVNGNQGNDTVYGGKQDDVVHGGKDDDWIYGDLGNDIVSGDLGNDFAFGGPNDPERVVLDGNDLIFGNSGANFLNGNVGDDTVRGGNENDTLHGGKNNDLAIGNEGSDRLFGDLGDDSLYGGHDRADIGDPEGLDFLSGGEGNDFLNGNENQDTLYGNEGCDILHGGKGNDLVFGNECNDALYGDKGADTITGGEGADIFVLGMGTGGATLADADVIADFGNGLDFIGLTNGQTFDNLNIFQGEGENQGNAIIQDRTTNEFLAIVQGADAMTLTSDRFTTEEVPECRCDDEDASPAEPLTSTPLARRPGEPAEPTDGGQPTVIFAPPATVASTDTDEELPNVIFVPPTTEPTDEELPDVVFDVPPPEVGPPTARPPAIPPTPTPTPSNADPNLTNPIANQNASPGDLFAFTVPENTFTDPDGDALTYRATLADGTPLPEWLNFDRDTGAFTGTPNNQDLGNLSVEVTALDGNGGIVNDVFELAIADGINQPPNLSNVSVSGTEDTAFTFSPEDFAAAYSDPEGNSLSNIKITSLPETGTLTLNGNPVEAGQEIGAEQLENLTFTPAADFTGNVTFGWNGFDGTEYAPTNATVNLNVSAADNTPPEVDLNGEAPGLDTTVTFDPTTDSVAIANNPILTDPDPDDNTLTSATVTITNPLDGDAEQLSVDTTGTNIDANFEEGTLSLTGEDSLENYEQVLNRIEYENVAENPDPTDRTIETVVNDGTDMSPVATTTVEFPQPVDLELTKTVSDPTTDIGDPLSYTITLTNAGGQEATGIQVSDSLPNWLNDIAFNAAAGSFDSSADVWNIPSLAAGESATLTISGTLARWGTIPNRAQVSALDQKDVDSTPNNFVDAEDDQALAEAIAALPTTVSLNNMTQGLGGFVLYGADSGDRSGRNVSQAGDVNGDGFDDIAIGTRYADGRNNDVASAGESYVVFGGLNVGPTVELGELTGTNGFKIYGIDEDDFSGRSVGNAGDINADGFDDIAIAARFGDGPDNTNTDSGETYIIYGSQTFGDSIDLANLNGTNGFTLYGIDEEDESGRDVRTAGDINGDGFDDIVIGAYKADGRDNNKRNAGETYVVFGSNNFDTPIDLADLDGTNGFVLYGVDETDQSGRAVNNAGDINGDGYDDIAIGAPQADGGADNPTPNAGETYVVYGGTNFDPELDLENLDGNNGLTIYGIDFGDLSGRSVSNAGDVNGDGFDDIIIGAQEADSINNTQPDAGESYVIFGNNNLGASIDLANLNGTNGFTIYGVNSGDLSGRSVSNAGDVNADGYDDLIVNAPHGDALNNDTDDAGEIYVVFGGQTFGSSLNLADLSGNTGFTLFGINSGDRSGRSVSAGDVNGDGFDDLLVGAPEGDAANNSKNDAGESYAIYGGDFTGNVTQHGGLGVDRLTGTEAADVLVGAQADDTLIGAGGADVLYGGAGNDMLSISTSNFIRIVGGTGQDTLRLDGDNFAIDLTKIPDKRIKSVEAIELNGNGNTLTLNELDVLHLSDNTNQVLVSGSSSNSLSAPDNWVSGGITAIAGETYNIYTLNQARLLVDADISQTVGASAMT